MKPIRLIIFGIIFYALLTISTPHIFKLFSFVLTNTMAIGGALILSVLFTYALKEN